MIGRRRIDKPGIEVNKVPFDDIKREIAGKVKVLQTKTQKCCFKLFKKPPKMASCETQTEEDAVKLELQKQTLLVDNLNFKIQIYARDVDNLHKKIGVISREKNDLKRRIDTLESLISNMDLELNQSKESYQTKVSEILSLKDSILNIKKDYNKRKEALAEQIATIEKLSKEVKSLETKVVEHEVSFLK